MDLVTCHKCGKIVPGNETFVKLLDTTEMYEYTCKECYYKESNSYQTRLDKVLAKFSNKISPYSRGKKYVRNGLVIFYNIEFKQFSIARESNILSLETVESLIKDMEANNE